MPRKGSLSGRELGRLCLDVFVQSFSFLGPDREPNIPDLGLLGKRIAKGEGIREDDLRPGSRRREVIKARKLFCQLAARKMGYCGGDVARFSGVTTSAVNKAANSEEVAALEQYS